MRKASRATQLATGSLRVHCAPGNPLIIQYNNHLVFKDPGIPRMGGNCRVNQRLLVEVKTNINNNSVNSFY